LTRRRHNDRTTASPLNHLAATHLTEREFQTIAGIAERGEESISDTIRQMLGFPKEADAQRTPLRRRSLTAVRRGHPGEDDPRDAGHR
jgi:hypothetical protein